MKTLYLHIGTPKTGTTSLQYFLSQNTDGLAKKSIYVHSGEKINNEEFSLMIRNRNEKRIDKYLGDFTNGIGSGKFILSCELLYTMPLSYELFFNTKNKNIKHDQESYAAEKDKYIAYLHKKLNEHFDEVIVIIYLRRQDQFLNSNYIQDVQFSLSVDIEEYIDLMAFECDYRKNLEIWERYFGSEQIRVIPYERECLKDGVEGAFCDLMNIPLKSLTRPDKEYNPTITPEIFEFKKKFNKAYLNTDFEPCGILFKFYGYTDQLLVHTRLKFETGGFKVLSYRRALELLDEYAESNKFVAEKYLDKKMLFSTPLPAPYELTTRSLNADLEFEYLASFLFLVQLDSIYKNNDLMRMLSESTAWNYAQDAEIESLKVRIKQLESGHELGDDGNHVESQLPSDKSRPDITALLKSVDAINKSISSIRDASNLEYRGTQSANHKSELIEKPLSRFLYGIYSRISKMRLFRKVS